ncbi:MAG: hypothetical protein ABI772_02055, partial [Bacteroidota bacterium]
MKPITTLLLLLICLSVKKSSAQNDSLQTQRKGYIGFSLGPSYPLPITAAHNLGSLKGERGLALSLIDFGYFFSRRFGVAVKWEGVSYLFSPNELNHYLYQTYTYKKLLLTDKWTSSALMAGVRIANQKKKSTQSLGLFIGLMNSETPEVEFRDSTNILITKQKA